MLRVEQLVADLSRMTLELDEAAARARLAEQAAERLRVEKSTLLERCASVELERDTLQRKMLLATEEMGAPAPASRTSSSASPQLALLNAHDLGVALPP